MAHGIKNHGTRAEGRGAQLIGQPQIKRQPTSCVKTALKMLMTSKMKIT